MTMQRFVILLLLEFTGGSQGVSSPEGLLLNGTGATSKFPVQGSRFDDCFIPPIKRVNHVGEHKKILTGVQILLMSMLNSTGCSGVLQ